jgi:hypothetical protein
MTADPTTTTRREMRHPEPSAAFFARERSNGILRELDAFRERQPLAARLCECLLLREMATRLGPILLEVAENAAEPLPPPTEAPPEIGRLVPRGAGQ